MRLSYKIGLLLLAALSCKAQTSAISEETMSKFIEILKREIKYVDSLEFKRKEVETHKEHLEVTANGDIIFVPGNTQEVKEGLKFEPKQKQRKECDGNATEVNKARQSLPINIR